MKLHTQRLMIRKFTLDDLEPLYQLLSDEEVMTYIEPPYSKVQTKIFLDKYCLREEPALWAVEDMSGKFVGYIIYHPYMEDSYEIGWLLLREEWGKGYASELTEALIEDARSKVSAVVIECDPGQEASKKIAEKFGFTYEGTEDGCEIYRLQF